MIRALDQALEYGSILEKVHRVVEFNQTAWLKPYIDFNTELRKKGKNDFEKDFFKLMNNAYESQLIRYARCCSNYSDFLSHHGALVTRLLSQGYKVNRLSNTFKKFYGRHTDLVGQYKKSVCQMFADSIS